MVVKPTAGFVCSQPIYACCFIDDNRQHQGSHTKDIGAYSFLQKTCVQTGNFSDFLGDGHFYEMSELYPSLEIQKGITLVSGVSSSREAAQYTCVT